MTTLVYIYPAAMVVMSIVAFSAYGIDKRKAKLNKWRIKERTLLLLAALLGAPGAFAGMKVFRHKTQHRQFTILVPVCLVMQLALTVWLIAKAV